MKKFFIGSLIFILVATVATFGIVFYTSLPLVPIAKMLNAIGVKTEGLTGSIASGVYVEQVSFGNKENLFILDKFKLSHNGLWSFFVKREINISELSVGKLSVKVKATPPSERNSVKQRPSPAPPAARAEPGVAGFGRNISIGKIDISNVEIAFSELQKPFLLDSLQIQKLTVVKGKLDFEKFTINSNAADIALDYGPSDPESPGTPSSTDKIIHLVLKPTYIKALKTPVSIDGRMRVDAGTFDRKVFFLTAFGDKAGLKFSDAGLLELQVKDLNLNDFLTDTQPIQRVSVHATFDPNIRDATMLKIVQGEFYIGLAKFVVSPGVALTPLTEPAQIQFRMTGTTELRRILITALITQDLDAGSKVGNTEASVLGKISLSSEPKRRAEDVLSLLYYGRNYSALKGKEKSQVALHKAKYIFN